MSDTEQITRDVRNLSVKAQEMYDASVVQYNLRISEAWKLVETSLKAAEDGDLTKASLRSLCIFEEDINKNFTKYSMIKEDFRQFLFRTKTSTSELNLKSLEQNHDEYSAVVEKLLAIISEQKPSALESMTSVSHCHSQTSNKSHFSSLVTLKRAKAQAANVSIKYTEEELKLRKLKAEIDEKEKLMVAKEKANMERSRAEFEAELHLLSVKKEAATTEAELRVLQEEEGSQLDALSEAVPERNNDLTDSHPFLETRIVLNFSPGQENELTNVNTQQLPETGHIQTNASTDGGLPQAHSSPLQEPPSLRTLDPLAPEFRSRTNHQSGSMDVQISEFFKVLNEEKIADVSSQKLYRQTRIIRSMESHNPKHYKGTTSLNRRGNRLAYQVFRP